MATTEASGHKLTAELVAGHGGKHGASAIKISRSTAPHDRQVLDVSFQRTVRVADTGEVNDLPPSLGSFPLYEIADYKERLPVEMVKQGGFFLPMYQLEAMWMNLSSSQPFAITIYVGGINAVSAEPAIETEATMMKRLSLMKEHKNIQDYIVTPTQLWLDGIATGNGTVRQFVAMPLGSGYSVEAQITGADSIGGLQIEVIPTKPTHFRQLSSDNGLQLPKFLARLSPWKSHRAATLLPNSKPRSGTRQMCQLISSDSSSSIVFSTTTA